MFRKIDMTEAEAKGAERGRVAALMAASDWLETKAAKCRQFPGADVHGANERAAAYENAASTLRLWASREQ